MDVDLRHLRSFLVVAEELNFTRAAEELSMTQPNLTRIIRKLEEVLGTQLFDRSTRHVTLTVRGEQLRSELDGLITRLDQVLMSSRESRPLRLGFCWLLPDGWAQQVMARFEQATGARVTPTRRDEQLAGIDRGEVDAAVLRGSPVLTPGLTAVPLFRERRVAAVSHLNPLARREEVHWNDFVDCPIVVNTVSGASSPQLWPSWCRPPVGAAVRNYDDWLEAVAAGYGVGIIPETAARRGIHSAIRFVEIREAPTVDVSLVVPTVQPHPLGAQFMDAVRAVKQPASEPSLLAS